VDKNLFYCFSGETEVLTWDGPRPIRELAGGTHEVLNRSAYWVKAPFKSYGIQPLMKITMTRNRQVKEIYATAEHRWFVRAGAHRRNNRQTITKDLKFGDRLSYVYPRSRIRQTTMSPFGVAHGFTYGDGTRNASGSVALICSQKKEVMLKWFPNSYTSADGEVLLIHHLPRFFKDRPSLNESVPYLLGWLAGYFAADGCVAADGTVILNSADRADLEFVRTLATQLGIGTFGITTQVRTGLGKEPSDIYRIHFVNNDLPSDFFLITDHRNRFENKEKAFSRCGWVIRSVEATDRVEEVFCAEVEDGNAFVLADNILTGNCFGCGEGGDVIRFIERTQDITFGAAVRLLSERYGIVDLDSNEPRRPARPIKRKISGIRQPDGYVAPSQSLAPFWDATKMEHVVALERVEACWGELCRPDYDFLLTMGIVPSDLIMELWRNVGMPNL
jgi:DNA primase